MKPQHYVILMAGVFCALPGWSQPEQREPYIGYLYPAGGRQGDSIRIFAGGQFLRGAESVFVSGDGVEGTVIHHYQPIRNLNGEQRRELAHKIRSAWEKRRAELPPAERKRVPSAKTLALGIRSRVMPPESSTTSLPDHPLLNDMENMSLRQLAAVAQEIRDFRKRQPNAQLAALVEIEIQIAPDAVPGDRELRLGVRSALTNPIRFQVGTLPEIREQEPNDPQGNIALPEAPPLILPIVLNGQIMPGDVDRFSFLGRQNQQIVVNVAARRLIPYLADAVPGWFQAVATLYDASGRELAHADGYRFCPDPVLIHTLPEDGIYEIEIRDALYRGREDFVYRIEMGELPFITHAFPLGGRLGSESVADIGGYNLPTTKLPLDMSAGSARIRPVNLIAGQHYSNTLFYAVDDLPECLEVEPNDTAETAQPITLPMIINGRIETPGDIDFFTFTGQAGEEVVVEVIARRLLSPLDSLIRVMDTQGTILAWNDDHKDRLSETLTHHADSLTQLRLPEDGTYRVQLSDAQRNGGQAYAYRLHVRKARPDFELLVAPSSLNIPAGRAATLHVYAVRRDGFSGGITLALVDAPKGFRIDGGEIPAGKESIRITVSAPARPLEHPVPLEIEGTALIAGKRVTRRAIPTEDMMQAFLPRHLVQSQTLIASVRPGGRQGRVWRQNADQPVLIPRGGDAPAVFRVDGRPPVGTIRLELSDPPEGVAIKDMEHTSRGLAFVISVDENTPTEYRDNLIVQAFLERPEEQTDTADATQNRVFLGVLPAIPIGITD